MPHSTYLIIGGGMTAAAAVAGIREIDADGSIAVIGEEQHPFYDRPPLSKGLWKGKSLETIWRRTGLEGVAQHLGRRAEKLMPTERRVIDDQGTSYTYEKLLLATGGRPRRLPFDDDAFIYYRTLDDYHRLRALAERDLRFAVIGGGFIGSEIAAALASVGKQTTVICSGEGIGARLFPAELTRFLNDFYRQKGVEVLTGSRALACEKDQGACKLKIHNSQTQADRDVVAEVVVAGIGIEPNVKLAVDAGLEVDDGICVDRGLETSQPGIYAAGDVASFLNPALDRRLRVEHEDNANTMGKLAGQAMAGKDVSYDYLPSFYSDLFELGFEAVGEVDSRLDTIADWKVPFREGVVYYLRDGRVRGVLLWNVWEQVNAARALIAEKGPFQAKALKGRLPAG
jgi:NADPH-dependent 2,4-dienoyl-CoA reductase/sulfur reductase-like enzyme